MAKKRQPSGKQQNKSSGNDSISSELNKTNPGKYPKAVQKSTGKVVDRTGQVAGMDQVQEIQGNHNI